MDTAPWYFVADVARQFRVTPATVRRWIREGRIPRGVHITRTRIGWYPADIRVVLHTGPGAPGTYNSQEGSEND